MSSIEINLRLGVRRRASTPSEIAHRQEKALALLGAVPYRRYDLAVNGSLVPCLVACIAALDLGTGKGSMIGPRVEGYGPFDLARFHRLTVAATTPPPVGPCQGQRTLEKALRQQSADCS